MGWLFKKRTGNELMQKSKEYKDIGYALETVFLNSQR